MNKDRIIVLMLFAFFGFTLSVNAQNNKQVETIDVSGSVYSDLGEPLEGILILNSNGDVSVSDSIGAFTIKAKLVDNIAFESDGFKRTILRVNAGLYADGNVVMQRLGFLNPDDDVDIPFGKINAVSSTGSVIRISGDQLEKHPSGQVYEALTGLIPGLQVRQTGSRPGLETYSVQYHGNSVTVLVDGIPMTQNLGLLEIDEVVFMRGASATAFMGEIGSEGILDIKTKRGSVGPRKILIQAETNYGFPTSMVDMQNSYNYAQTINNSLISDGLSPFYDQGALDAYKDHTDLVRYPDVDYRDLVYRDMVTRQQYTAQVSGGTEDAKYFANFSYNGMQGMENSPDQRTNEDFNFRTNLDIRLTDYMVMDLGLMGSYADQHSPQLATGTIMSQVTSLPPNAFPLMLGDSIYITSQQYGRNMKYEMEEAGYADQTDRVMSINLGLNFDLSPITKGLALSVRGTGDVWNQSQLGLNNDGDEYELLFVPIDGGGDSMVINQTAWAVPQLSPSSEGTSVRRRYNFSSLLSYNKIFDDHAIDAGLIAYLYKYDFSDNNVDRFVSQSFNMRTNYTYKKKYAAELILNYAGTNKLLDDNQYKLFPTLGASWIISEEDFIAESSKIDYLKLRGSWGQQGYLSSFSNYFSFLDDWSITDLDKLTGVGSTTASTATSYKTQTASPGLDWPVISTTNIGLDAVLFEKKVSVQMDYFHTKKSELITRGVTLDMAGGDPYYTYSNQNAEDGNALELGLSYNNHKGNIRYSIGANVGYFKAIRTEYAEPAYTNIEDLREGDATDAIYGLVDNGLFASDADALASNQYIGDIFKDDIIYKDVNNDGVVDTRDIEVLGNSVPRINYGVNVLLAYKAISLYVNGAGFAGYDINLSGNSQYQISSFDSRPASMYENLPNGNTQPRLTVLGSDNNYRTSRYWLVPGNFFRLENIELAYNLPARFAQNWFINTAKVFVRGKNILVLSKFENSDPEYIDGGYSDYPLFKEYSVGVNLSF
ncbi:MAG: SusC/RagA family TonB-linked outer membrane protein [Bacteroidales bacterium]|nr:SusC/RagA family TonB-linked outer membrane protein [Bacteroidales bacterium]MCF8389155.1 SusC/RagA family TonB-linked outer membrane protein [Bacteroidales bacterium]